MGRYFGIAAVDLIVKEDFGKMVSYRNGRITAVPLDEVIGKPSLVDINRLYDTERYNGRRTILNRCQKKIRHTRQEVCALKPTGLSLCQIRVR